MNVVDNMKEKKIEYLKDVRNKRIAMYVIYDKDGILDGYRKYYLQELKKVTDYVLAVVSGTLTPESRTELEGLVDEILVRENKGLLAGSWIDGLAHIGWEKLYTYDELLMLNDSFFGPFYPLEEMFVAMEKSDADFYGVMKNFEEKSYTHINGRALKHGYFRGSICYFYVIKRNLLHSFEFKKYWTQSPNIKEDWDTYFFAEMDFYDYVIDCGFKVDAYQTDKLKGYFFDNLTHCMKRLIEEDKIPFARIRPFCTNMKDQSLLVNYGKDPREALEYIEHYTKYDTNLIWDYILRTKNISDIYNQLQLEYVISKDKVERNFEYNKKIAVILHIYYNDLVEKVAEYCVNFPDNTDFYVTTTTEETLKTINEEFNKRKLNFVAQIRPNLGVAMSSLWVTYADIVTSGEYEYICYFHDKKSPYTGFAISGEQFAKRCYDNLVGSKAIVKNIINLFEENKRLGVLGAPMVYHGGYFSVSWRSWYGNYKKTKEVAKRLNLNVEINKDKMPVAPYGDMFWFRSDALKKAIGTGLTYDDFNETYKPDFTIMHAIERIPAFAAQDSGYYYADVINNDDARSDLINFQYMLYDVCKLLCQKGLFTNDFSTLKYIIQNYEVPRSSKLKVFAKAYIEPILPPVIWDWLKGIYFRLGGSR